ncbi:MAG TPA: 2-C-methyl-D-erythritol 4-phosphate cytidylyltransferase [Pyrinomonadaceae bacterium]|jgi:2-C-methyl-D-erythritol 4-phosphate cytidylyltransferase|nr:2-C-methyl-D-erythritol 4-phosphate cytidylyltransferase [Pyrinomonadaceae bacterium]
MNIAIIVAAGRSERFGGNTPKQFLELNGKPVVIHTMLRFEACPLVDEIILVLPVSHKAGFIEIAGKYPLKKLTRIIGGGASRAESVLNGLKAVRPGSAETAGIVAVHDGARPLVTFDEIAETIKKAEETGAAVLTAPVTDTIKSVSGGEIRQTIDRNSLRRALTPQCFRYEILKKAYEMADDISAATDESYLVEKAGYPVSFVEGSASNIKITTPEDLALAEFLMKEM